MSAKSRGRPLRASGKTLRSKTRRRLDGPLLDVLVIVLEVLVVLSLTVLAVELGR